MVKAILSEKKSIIFPLLHYSCGQLLLQKTGTKDLFDVEMSYTSMAYTCMAKVFNSLGTGQICLNKYTYSHNNFKMNYWSASISKKIENKSGVKEPFNNENIAQEEQI